MMNTDDDASKAQRAVQSVEVGGRLLLALAAHKEPMLLKELAAKAELPSSRAHPYLVSFGRLGLIRQDSDNGRYALGPAALQLGLTALNQLEPVQVVRPIAQELASQTGQAVAVAMWGNLGPTVIQMIDATHPLHVAMRVGTVMSPFDTATGRAFAGVLSAAQINDAMAGMALGFTGAPRPFQLSEYEHAIHSAQTELRKYHCTRAVGQPIPGVNAFSAPIFNHEGQPVLVLTLMGREESVPSAWTSSPATALKEAAVATSIELGYQP